ncbi:hypothetical protein AWC38_SpisGene2151, partial [Stylophora pistillata]
MEEDSGERDEGKQLDMGSPGTTSTRQKRMALFGRGLMCFTTRRELNKQILSSGKDGKKQNLGGGNKDEDAKNLKRNGWMRTFPIK